MYVLCAISGYSSTDELTDETKRLCDVQPFVCILRITEREFTTSNKITKNITHLIGKALNEFKELKNPEIHDFRYKMGLLGKQISYERQKMTWQEKMLYQFPPRIANTADLPETVRGRLRNDHFVLVAKFENDVTSFTFNVHYHTKPQQLLDTVLNKKALTTNRRHDRYTEYILKISGQDEYLYGDYPLVQFLYIQDTLSRDGVPTVVTQCVHNVQVFEDSICQEEDQPKNLNIQTQTLRKKGRSVSSWNIKENFQLIVKAVNGLNCDTNRTVEIGVQIGLFHGGKSLCEPKKTSETKLCIATANFNETLNFDISVSNVPRMARLCLVIYEIAKNSKGSTARGRRVKDKVK